VINAALKYVSVRMLMCLRMYVVHNGVIESYDKRGVMPTMDL